MTLTYRSARTAVITYIKKKKTHLKYRHVVYYNIFMQ